MRGGSAGPLRPERHEPQRAQRQSQAPKNQSGDQAGQAEHGDLAADQSPRRLGGRPSSAVSDRRIQNGHAGAS